MVLQDVKKLKRPTPESIISKAKNCAQQFFKTLCYLTSTALTGGLTQES